MDDFDDYMDDLEDEKEGDAGEPTQIVMDFPKGIEWVFIALQSALDN